MAAMHRLFVALRPPPAARAALVALMGGVAEARWQSDEQLHLTLRFIGDVDGAVAEDVAVALDAVRHPPIDLTLAGLGTFARRGRIDTLWIGARPRAVLTALHRKVDQALVRAGLDPERRAYLPHITLARFGARGGDVAGRAGDAEPVVGPFTVDAFQLFESHLGRDGAEYVSVARYPLRA